MSNLDTVLSVHEDHVVLHVRHLRKPKILFTITNSFLTVKGENLMSTIKAGQKVAISIDPRD